MDTIRDLEERYALEVQIGEFGQVPKQLFSTPHPARVVPSDLSPRGQSVDSVSEEEEKENESSNNMERKD